MWSLTNKHRLRLDLHVDQPSALFRRNQCNPARILDTIHINKVRTSKHSAAKLMWLAIRWPSDTPGVSEGQRIANHISFAALCLLVLTLLMWIVSSIRAGLHWLRRNKAEG